MTSIHTTLSTPDDLDAGGVDGFRQNGFVAFERFVDADALDMLRAAYDDIIDGRTVAAGDRQLGGIIRQVMGPSVSDERFRTNDAIRAGVDVATRTFGHDRFEMVYDMMIDKPAGTDHETPWHQDLGYFGKPVSAPGTSGAIEDIQFWVALDDVDTTNGCMQFVPRPWGSDALEHTVVSGAAESESRLIGLTALANESLRDDPVVACPIPAGGATAHFVSTPHFTGANMSVDRSRRAFIFNIGPSGMASAATAQKRDLWDES